MTQTILYSTGSRYLLGAEPTYRWESPISPQKWMDNARCAETDPDAFFPDQGESNTDAKSICSGCLVAQQCLNFAIENDERFGVWGGLSYHDRKKLAAVRQTRSAKTRASVKSLIARGQTNAQIAGLLEISEHQVWVIRRELDAAA